MSKAIANRGAAARAPRGRPALDPSVRRTATLPPVRVTPAQRAKWDAMVDSADRVRAWLDGLEIPGLEKPNG